MICEVPAGTKFIQTYCVDKRADAIKTDGAALHDYKEDKGLVQTRFHLCEDCGRMRRYAYARLRACPHAEKPRCHHCPHPCYEREMWVNMARMMKYSGMKLGFTKIKKFFSFAKS